MEVFAAIQEEQTGRVYSILTKNSEFFWLRVTPGYPIHGAFDSLNAVFNDMALIEGRTAGHWTKVFTFFYPNIPLTQSGRSKLTC